MHNVIGKVLLIIIIVLIALFTYRTINDPSVLSTTISVNATDQQFNKKKQ